MSTEGWLTLIIVMLSNVQLAAFAGRVSGAVEAVMARASDGLVLVSMNGTPSSQPSCATAPDWIVPDENSEVREEAVRDVARHKG